MPRNSHSRTDICIILAVILIAASIVFPAFAGNRDKSKQIICLTNIKELGQALLMYAQDNNNTFPPFADYDSKNRIPGTNWDKKIFPYVKNERTYQCPVYYGTDKKSTYAINLSIAWWGAAGYNRIVPIEAATLQIVRDPSKVITLLDAKFQEEGPRPLGYGDGTRWFWRKEFKIQGVPMIHDGGDNICFVDGHAGWFNTTLAEPKSFQGEVRSWNGITFDPECPPEINIQ